MMLWAHIQLYYQQKILPAQTLRYHGDWRLAEVAYIFQTALALNCSRMNGRAQTHRHIPPLNISLISDDKIAEKMSQAGCCMTAD